MLTGDQDYINVKLTTEPHVEELTALVASVVQDYSAHVSFCVVLSSVRIDGIACIVLEQPLTFSYSDFKRSWRSAMWMVSAALQGFS
jgi:hypothetical protein